MERVRFPPPPPTRSPYKIKLIGRVMVFELKLKGRRDPEPQISTQRTDHPPVQEGIFSKVTRLLSSGVDGILLETKRFIVGWIISRSSIVPPRMLTIPGRPLPSENICAPQFPQNFFVIWLPLSAKCRYSLGAPLICTLSSGTNTLAKYGPPDVFRQFSQ